MKLYHYHPETKEYLCSTNATLDPLETKEREEPVYLIPAHSTMEAPPSAPEGYAAIRTDDGGWALVEDLRGKTFYSTVDAGEIIMDGLGPIPDFLTDQFPSCLFPKWNGGQWIEDHEAVRAAEEAAVKARLQEIDLKSIRSLREWLAAREDAPEFIKTHEAEAVTERAKLSE